MKYLIFFTIFIRILSQKLIKFPLKNNTNSYDCVFLIGKEKKIKYFEVDLKSPITFSSRSFFVPEKDAEIIDSGEMTIFNRLREYSIIAQPLYSDTFKLEKFYFYYFRDGLTQYDSFGLAYKIQNEKLSIIQTLIAANLISNAKFGIANEDNENFLYFGGFSEDLKQKLPFTENCKVNKDYPTWGCEITKIAFGGKEYHQKTYIYFGTKGKYSLFPKGFVVFLYENVFKKHITKGTCEKIGEETYYPTLIECECQFFINNFPKFEFSFDGFTVPIQIKDYIFYKDKVNCRLPLDVNYNYEDAFELGLKMIDALTVEFDYENSLISFYSSRNFSFSVGKNVIVIIVICTVLLALWSLFIGLVYFLDKN